MIETRQLVLEEALDRYPGPLTNTDIWINVIGGFIRASREPFLAKSQRDEIVANYKASHQKGDVPVAELMQEVGLEVPKKDLLLTRACFNYDYEFGGAERHRKALDEFYAGRGEIDRWGMRYVSHNAPEHLSLEEWVDIDFKGANKDIISEDIINNQAREVVFTLSHGAPKWYDIFDIFGPYRSPGWRRYIDLQEAFNEKILPLLSPNQLIKAASGGVYRWPIGQPTLVAK